MRITVELINNSLSYLNPLHERELDLRGNKIPVIENLGAAGQHEAIDFTDNDIAMLANFPASPRLKSLLVARNRISSIEPSLSIRLPSLHTLVLTQNSMAELADLTPLKGFKKLEHLSLVDNPVTSKENYRYFVLWLCPSIRFFDFQKVKDVERTHAKELFGTIDSPTDLATSIMATRSGSARAAGAGSGANGPTKSSKVHFTEQEKQRFEKLVRNAKTLAEVQKLEKAFKENRLPTGLLAGDDDAMDET